MHLDGFELDFVRMGAQTSAIPHGRRAGELLSPGMSPSPLALGDSASRGTLLSAVQSLDLTAYPVVAVFDLKQPWASAALRPVLIVPVIRRFLDVGLSFSSMWSILWPCKRRVHTRNVTPTWWCV